MKSVWIPKGVNTSQNESAKIKWIPNGTRIVSSNIQGPKKFGYPKQKFGYPKRAMLQGKFNKEEESLVP